MKEELFEKAIETALHKDYTEVNIHDSVMKNIVEYELKKMKLSYFFELLLSSFLIIFSIAALIIINWSYSLYQNVFIAFPISTSIIKNLSLGFFSIMLLVLSIVSIRIIILMIKEKKNTTTV